MGVDAAQTLVGRQADLAVLEHAVAGAARGQGGTVLVAGEAGIGKTRLARAAADRARGDGVKVAWASCWQSGAAPAFWPWTQVLAQMAGGHRPTIGIGPPPLSAPARATHDPVPAVGPVGPVGRAAATLDPEGARLDQFEAVVHWLRHASAEDPWLVVIDDLHWADAPSLRLLEFLVPALDPMAVTVVATTRDLAQAAELGMKRVLSLRGLSDTEVADLVGGTVGPGRSTPNLAAAVRRLTGGNPLFVTELVRLLESRGELERVTRAGRDGAPALPVPDSLRTVLAGRLSDLSARAGAVVAVGAVAGDEFGIEVVAAVEGVTPDTLLAAVGEAVGAGVLAEAGVGRYAFAHPLLCAAIYDGLGVARRVRLHERVGSALEALRARGHTVSAAALAHHFVCAAPGGAASRAVTYAGSAAADAMAVLAYEEAADLLAAAVGALELDAAAGDRVRVMLSLGDARGAAGDRPRARQTYQAAAALARSTGRTEELAHAALGLAGGHGFEVAPFDTEQVGLLEEALAALGGSRPLLRAALLARLSVAQSLTCSVEDRLTHSEEAVDLARAGAGTPPAAAEAGAYRSLDGRVVLAQALAAHCDAIAGPDHVERRAGEASEIVGLARAAGDRPTELLGLRLRLVARLEAGDLPGARADADAFALVAGTLRQPLFNWYVPLWRGMEAAVAGRFSECERALAEATDLGRQAHSANAAMLVAAQRMFLLAESGRVDELTDVVGPLLAEGGTTLPVWAQMGLALIAAWSGDLAAARSRLDALVPEAVASAPVDSEWLPFLAQAAFVVHRIGGHRGAPLLYEMLAPHGHRFVIEGIGAMCCGSVERYLGLLAAAMGRRDEAVRHFEAALAVHRRHGARLLVARTLADAGAALGDESLTAQAVAAYRDMGIDTPGAAVDLPPSASRAGDATARGTFRRQGELWTVSWQGVTVHLRHSKGLADLARLLGQPGREVAAVDLVGAPSRAGRRDGRPAGRHDGGDLGPMLDDRARTAYKARLVELEAELAEADAAGDAGRSTRAGDEREMLLAQLAGAYGLGGRARRQGDPAERARSAATWRLRDAVSRVEAALPALGRHLRAAVHTGSFCSYVPPEPVEWGL